MNEVKMNDLLAQMRTMAASAQGRAAANIAAAPAATGPDFAALIKNALQTVNANQQQAQQLATAFELGDRHVNLAEVMISLQKANLSFQAMSQVRNKLVTAYQDIMNIPV
jgi:flagellar hook-basal body complex protein FliE